MKATGIIRRVDDVGRVVIPKEIRKRIGIVDGEPMEIYLEDDAIVYKKYNANISVGDAINRLRDHIENEIDCICQDELLEKIVEMKNILKERIDRND